MATLEDHNDVVNCLVVVGGGGSGVGARVVSESVAGTMRVCDMETGTCVATVTGHTDRMTCLAVVGGGGNGLGAWVVSGLGTRRCGCGTLTRARAWPPCKATKTS